MEKIRAIIVDDEQEARDVLSSLLNDFSDIQVLSCDESVDQAFQSVVHYQPDLIFLDIEMPQKDGFVLLRKIKDLKHKPTIIFITAYNQFAIEAIKHAAFDYILKPVDIDELSDTIRRYRAEVDSTATLSRIENLLQVLQEEKIRFNSRTGSVYIKPSEIIYCQADGNYTDLFLTGNQRQTISLNIGRLEEVLPPNRFIKISRSNIINRQYLCEINRKERTCSLKVDEDCITLKIPSKYISILRMD